MGFAAIRTENVSRPATAGAVIAFVLAGDVVALTQRLADRGLRLNHP